MAGEVSVSIGDNNARIIAQEPQFDPQTGVWFIDRWEGSEEALKARMSIYIAAGFRAHCYQFEGPIWRGEFSNQPTQAETGIPEITDQWEFDTEFMQESIWSNPLVRDLALTDLTLSKWKKEIETAIENKRTIAQFAATGVIPLTPGLPGTPPTAEEVAVFITVNRGQTAYESRRQVVRRVRSIPTTSAAQVAPDALERIYTRAALITVFAIPALIAARLPPEPALIAPDFTAWTWKMRRDASSIAPQIAKAQETREWTYGLWSTLTYILVV